MDKNQAYVILPVIVFVVSSVLLVMALYYQWMGEAREGVMLFCELARDGLIKQPANSFSNLGFSIVGLYIGWLTYKNKFTNHNLFTVNRAYPFSYALILVLLGAGSFAMHATNTAWGGFFDLLAMFLVSSFYVSYNIKRLIGASDLFFTLFFLFNVAICSYVYLSPWNHFGFILSYAEIMFASHLLTAIAIDLYRLKTKQINIQVNWAFFGIVTLIIAFVIWNLSRTHESIWCNPSSLIQGHAVWHILNAVSLFAIFRYYSSEVVETTH